MLNSEYSRHTRSSVIAWALTVIPILVLIFALQLYKIGTEAIRAALLVSLLAHLVILTLASLAAAQRKMIRGHQPPVLSVLYYEHLERQVLWAGVVVFVAMLFGYLFAPAPDASTYRVVLATAAAPGALFALTVSRLEIIRARVCEGSFGTQHAEATDLICLMYGDPSGIEKREGMLAVLPLPEQIQLGGALDRCLAKGFNLLLTRWPGRTCLGAAIGAVAATSTPVQAAFASSHVPIWMCLPLGMLLIDIPRLRNYFDCGEEQKSSLIVLARIHRFKDSEERRARARLDLLQAIFDGKALGMRFHGKR